MSLKIKILIGFSVLVLGIQFFRPDKNFSNESITTEELSIDGATLQILDKACFDCHSDNTRYKWYSEIMPIGWLVSHDIEEGKEKLNFSEWKSYSNEKREHKLEEINEEVAEKEMPEALYLTTHSEAKLTEQEIEKIIAWTKK